MRRITKRGTEKPIEIFVALFVILAVALVMLKLFQSQITEKQKQITDFQQEQKAQEMRQNVELHCQAKCTQASNNGCSLQSLAALCMGGSHQVVAEGEWLDLNGNNEPDFNVEEFGGEGVCEDRVYCFNMIDSCCARKISADSCAGILEQYWNSKSYSDEQKTTLCSQYLSHGDCPVPTDEEVFAWWESPNFSTLCG